MAKLLKVTGMKISQVSEGAKVAQLLHSLLKNKVCFKQPTLEKQEKLNFCKTY